MLATKERIIRTTIVKMMVPITRLSPPGVERKPGPKIRVEPTRYANAKNRTTEAVPMV